MLFGCRQRNHNVAFAEQGLQLRVALVGDMPQPRIGPAVGAVKHDELTAGIKDDVAGVGRGLRVPVRQRLAERADLLAAAVGRPLDRQRPVFAKRLQRPHGVVRFPLHGNGRILDGHLQHGSFSFLRFG